MFVQSTFKEFSVLLAIMLSGNLFQADTARTLNMLTDLLFAIR